MPSMVFNDKKSHYVVVTGVIVKDGRFLIAKRSPHEKAFPNEWTVPGGKLEVDDYVNRPKDAESQWYNVLEGLLRREVEEEVGLKIKEIKYLTSLTFIRPDGIPSVIISLYADHAEGEVKLSEELTDHKWVTLEESKNYKLISGLYEELEMLDKILKGEKVGEWKKK
jgi:8-oxo-dGTP pyrophosphatase MutT (NUDIX family)